jgi:hypothetical protein
LKKKRKAMTSKEGAIFHIFRIHFFLKEAFQEFGLGNQTWTIENGVEIEKHRPPKI